MTEVKQKPDWKKIVKDSNGTREFLPEAFVEEAKAIEADKTEFRKGLQEVAKNEIELNVRTQNLFLKIRDHFAKEGVEGIWTKDLGFEGEAMKEGEFIVNLMDEQPRR